MDRLDQLDLQKQGQEPEPIKTGSFGGLNTVTPILNLPYSDSPRLLNTTTGISGSMSKRPGTAVVYSEDGAVGGFSSATVRTPLGHHYVIAKQSQSLRVYETTGDTTALVMTKANVWNTEASSERAVTVVTNEVLPRVFFCTGKNVPVQLQFGELRYKPGVGGTSITIPDNYRTHQNATTSNVIIYRNGVREAAGYSVSWAGDTLTIGSLPVFIAGTTFDVVIITWQWVGEALRYLGDQLYFATTKFHIDQTDQNIPIPETLRDNVFLINSTRTYPFYVYKSTNYNDSYTLAGTYNPATINEYHFGSGAIHVPGIPFRPAPVYVTFGAIRPPVANPEEVCIIRGRYLPFNGGTGASGSNLRVVVNGIVYTQNTNAAVSAANTYYLRDNTGAIITNTSTKGHHITFDSTPTIGLFSTDEVVIVNIGLSDIGSSASSTTTKYLDGSCQPMYGLGRFSVYSQGFHPSVVSSYQGRIVFAGWRHDPLHIVASEVWDSLQSGENFINLDIPQNEGLATEPVDVQVTSFADDYLVNIYELHNSLFIFTRNAVFSLRPTQGALSATEITLSKVASIGLVNARAIDLTENTIFFLSDSGVYDLTPTIESGDYVTGERSIKIRNLVNRQLNETNRETAFIVYNKVTSEVYLGLPSKSDTITASRLYVYSIFRDSWLQYGTPSGWNLWGATPIIDTTKGVGFLLWVTTKYSGELPNNLIALLTDYDSYLDFTTFATGTGVSQQVSLPPTPNTTITTTAYQHEYRPTFDITPFPEVNDLLVTLDGVTLDFHVDWEKRANGTVYLLANPGAGRTLVLRARRPINDDEVGELNHGTTNYKIPVVFVNNILMKEGADYTVLADGSVSLTAPAGAAIKVGVAYLTLYATPLFTQGVLGRFKRLIHFYGYFNNAEGLDNFTGSDVTGAQSPDQIVDRPKQRMGVEVAVAYDSGYSSELTYDLYSFSSLVWDFSFFDTAPNEQNQPYVLFKEPIQGVGYGFQVYFYSWDEKFFDMVGYQVDGKLKGRYKVR